MLPYKVKKSFKNETARKSERESHFRSLDKYLGQGKKEENN